MTRQDEARLRRRGLAGAAVTLCILCGTTSAQTPRPEGANPASDPALNDPSIEDDLSKNRAKQASPVVKPVGNGGSVTPDEARPAPQPGKDWTANTGAGAPKGSLLPDGTFIAGRSGAIVRSPAGNYVFVPAPGGEGAGDAAPMVLLPNLRLAQVAGAFAEVQSPHAANVSGQVFVHRQQQYLLLSVFSMSRESANGAERSNGTQAEPGSTPKPDALAGGADVKALMEQLDSRKGAPRAMDQGVMAPTQERAERRSGGTLLAEGTVITSRTARLVRGPSGIVIAFDNDTNSSNYPSMALLNCRLLEQLEALTAARGENLQIKISGRTTTYDGRNYLLPSLYQVVRPGGLKPLQ